MRRVSSWLNYSCLLKLALFFVVLSSSLSVEAAVNPKQGPKIMVPPVLGIARTTSLKSHYLIVYALRKQFGERVVDDTQILEAQKKLHLGPRKLRKPKAVAELAKAVGAERALVITATRRGVSVAVYVDVHKAPTRFIRIRNIKARRIGKKQAKKIARLVARKATLLLSAEPFPQLTAVSPKGEKASLTRPQDDEQQGQSDWDAVDVVITDEVKAPQPGAEILAEELREKNLKKTITGHKINDLSLFVAAGFALSQRQLDLSGSQAIWVIPVQAGLLPFLSLSAAVLPLHFVPQLRSSRYNNLKLQVRYQRGLYRSLYQGEEVSLEDDNMNVRVSYSQALWSWSKSPSLGLGLGYGWQRAEINSELALLSTYYSFVELYGLLRQPLWPDRLDFSAVLSARQALAGDSALRPAPSWSGELWLTGKIQPWWFARLGLRSQGFRAWRGALLQVNEQDNSLLFELGGYY